MSEREAPSPLELDGYELVWDEERGIQALVYDRNRVPRGRARRILRKAAAERFEGVPVAIVLEQAEAKDLEILLARPAPVPDALPEGELEP